MKNAFLSSVVLGLAVAASPADEGMWLFTNPPRKFLEEKYKFDATTEWLEHLQKSSVRFPRGSASFVSPDGLVITNHHVGLDVLQQISDPGKKDYVKDGFLARTRGEEVKARNQELNVLMKIEDVTDRVNKAVTPDMSADKAAAARRAVMSEIETEGKARAKEAGIDPAFTQVVTLYQGGQYHLYTYKKYTDVRLVFAPEQQIAFYGGDPDNFEYPRYDLDICIFRVYENDKPIKVQNYLKWSQEGAKDGELIFVSGNPGRTSRLFTVADLKYQRDRALPARLEELYRREVSYSAFSNRSDENARRAKEELFSVQNSRKALNGELEGLLAPSTMIKKQEQEKKLREMVGSISDLNDAAGAWDKISKAQTTIGQNRVRYNMLEAGRGFNSQLFAFGRELLRAAEERPKPNRERLREYGEARLESLTEALFANEPIYDDFETVKLADSLTFLADQMGADNDLVKKVLAGKSPSERADEVIRATKLKDPAFRKKLYEGGKAAVDAAQDPMIELARLVDKPARDVRKIVEAQSEIKQQAYAQIAKAKFAVEGTNAYPDATFTPRLAFGVVKGYEENGKHVPFETTFAGLYERAKEHHDKPPFDLPERWVTCKDKLDLKTPFNFVCTADIIGGNSGSPVVNRKGEFVGIIFDGNIQSLVLDFVYTEDQGRALAVHSQGIIEALRTVYDAGALADELTGTK
jgi:hypothetical protein